MPFVSFEGVDGAGKTTQLVLLAEWLESQGQTVVRTKEPDGGRLGADLRSILARDRSFSLSAVEELLLVAAARYDHVRSVIRPVVKAGNWVLCDRFVDSTFALQVHAAGASPELFHAVTRAVVGQTQPDLTIILDIDPEHAAARRQARGAGPIDPAERTRDFGRVRKGFQLLAGAEPHRCRLIDADQDLGSVALAVQDEVRALGLLPAAEAS